MISGTLSSPEPAERDSVLLLDPDSCAESGHVELLVCLCNMQIRLPNGSKHSGQLCMNIHILYVQTLSSSMKTVSICIVCVCVMDQCLVESLLCLTDAVPTCTSQ